MLKPLDDWCMHAMVCSRLDISHVIIMVGKYTHNLGKLQWQAVKWILRFIIGIIDVGIAFQEGSLRQVIGFVDLNNAKVLDKCKSTTLYVFTLSSGPICW